MDKIAVLIPCYNEAKTVKKVVEDFKREIPEATIYVYDNNSKDGTDKIAKEAGAIVRYETRQGKNISRLFRHLPQSFCCCHAAAKTKTWTWLAEATISSFTLRPKWKSPLPTAAKRPTSDRLTMGKRQSYGAKTTTSASSMAPTYLILHLNLAKTLQAHTSAVRNTLPQPAPIAPSTLST